MPWGHPWLCPFSSTCCRGCCPHRVGISLLGSPQMSVCGPSIIPAPISTGQDLGTALGGMGTAQGGSIQGEPLRSTAECWKSSKKTPQPSWKKRINKERSTASGFFKLRVSGLVFFSPLARCPAGTLSRRGGGLCLLEGRTRLGMVPRAQLHPLFAALRDLRHPVPPPLGSL